MSQKLSYFGILFLFVTSSTLAQVKTVPVNKVLESVSKALEEIESKANLPAPAKVNVTFQTEVTKESNAGINILIFRFGRKWKRQQSNEVSYNFKLLAKESLDKETIDKELARVMKFAIDEALNIQNEDLELTDFSVKISFVLERTNEIGGEYEIIALPITPSLGRSWKKKAVHSIKITFEKHL